MWFFWSQMGSCDSSQFSSWLRTGRSRLQLVYSSSSHFVLHRRAGKPETVEMVLTFSASMQASMSSWLRTGTKCYSPKQMKIPIQTQLWRNKLHLVHHIVKVIDSGTRKMKGHFSNDFCNHCLQIKCI